MSPNIEIDEDVFDFLKSRAEPLVDTPSSVLRRLLGLNSAGDKTPGEPLVTATASTSHARVNAPSKGTKAKRVKAPKRTRAASGTLLPEEKYERPLLKALVDADGQAPYRDVVEAVGRELKDELMPADFENLNSGAVRWQSRLQFVRLRLIERGYLDKNAPRGVWSITDAGRAAFENGEGS